jgi:penicillin-binding protein 1A
MTGGSLPAQTWHDIMVVAHQGVEIKDIPGIGPGKKLPPDALAAANANAKAAEINPGPPPILTRRGANILVRVEKLFDEAAKTVAAPGKTSSSDNGKPAAPSAVAFPDSFASATPDRPAEAAPLRKN